MNINYCYETVSKMDREDGEDDLFIPLPNLYHSYSDDAVLRRRIYGTTNDDLNFQILPHHFVDTNQIPYCENLDRKLPSLPSPVHNLDDFNTRDWTPISIVGEKEGFSPFLSQAHLNSASSFFPSDIHPPDLKSVKTCSTIESYNSTIEDHEVLSSKNFDTAIVQQAPASAMSSPLSERSFESGAFFDSLSFKTDQPTEFPAAFDSDSEAESLYNLHAGVSVSSFLSQTDKNLVSDFTNAVVNEMQVTFFRSRDRKGSRATIPIGFPGMSCRHCNGSGRSGRYFPSSIKTISDSKKSLYAMHKHLSGCKHCPDSIKCNLDNLFTEHVEGRKQNRRQGAQRRYFRKIWLSLHPDVTEGSR
jgi:hypothetical protein